MRGMNSVERRISNKTSDISVREFYPSDMIEGETLFAKPNNKPMRLYKKFKGVRWFVNLTKKETFYANASHTHKASMLLLFGRDAEISATPGATTTVDAKTVDGAENSQGYRMIGAGTVVGVSIQAVGTNAAGGGTLRATVQLNGTNRSMYVEVNDYVGNVGDISTSNSFVYADGDKINVELRVKEDDLLGTIAFDNIAVVVKVQEESQDVT
jgi:hypothetical protein